ncbi:hypothetical protein BDW59DRAFT_80281 [Aspergillus cavernicola]|uniref:Uncharacterized protein n=1 Tax=Aspergillus cavernicola TaxID=176166 RepID=A0ABR4IAW7_9EURO
MRTLKTRTHSSGTSLLLAAGCGLEQILRFLLHQENLTITDYDGRTSLSCCIGGHRRQPWTRVWRITYSSMKYMRMIQSSTV